MREVGAIQTSIFELPTNPPDSKIYYVLQLPIRYLHAFIKLLQLLGMHRSSRHQSFHDLLFDTLTIFITLLIINSRFL